MAIDDKTKDEKLKYDIKKEKAKISAFSSSKIDRYEYLTDEGIFPSDQSRIIYGGPSLPIKKIKKNKNEK